MGRGLADLAWRVRARVALAALAPIGALAGCNAITGADSLSTSPEDPTSTADVVSPPSGGHHGDAATSPSTPFDAGGASDASPFDAAPFDSGADGGGGTVFFDDFSRPDNGDVGNGWLEKSPSLFSLSSGAVLEANSSASYKDLLVRRPTTEDARDVQVDVDVTLPASGGDTSLYARVQPASDTSGSLVSYTFYPGDFDVVYLDRDIGGGTNNSVPVASTSISPALVGGASYHMMLRVTGTSPVHIDASMTTAAGATIASISVDDTSPDRIVASGQFGFGSGGGDSRFDNFRAITFTK